MEIGLLQALISVWPPDQAVRLCDERGQTVAQNGPAVEACSRGEASPDTCQDAAPQAHTTSLVEGWTLQTRPIPNPLEEIPPPANALSDEPALATSGASASHTAHDSTAFRLQASRKGQEGELGQDVQLLSRGIAHELRNPLAAILTAVGLLQDDPNATPETVLLLGVVRKEAYRMNRILTEFSAYVRPRPAQPAQFDAAQALRTEVSRVVQERDAALGAIEVDDDLPAAISVVADEEQFREVVRQVLLNAFEAMPCGGSISVSHTVLPAHQNQGATDSLSAAPDSVVRFCIRDSGMGLSHEAVERAFQPFFSSKSQSTGLGLSIARSAVEASGGRIWIENNSSENTGESAPPTGATVAIELPVAS